MNKPNKTTKVRSSWGIFWVGIFLGCGAVYGPLVLSANSGPSESEQPAPAKEAGVKEAGVKEADANPEIQSATLETVTAGAVAEPAEPAKPVVPAESTDSVATVSEKTDAKDESKGVLMESPPNRGLDSNLYMQTSAEYRACCIQAYRWAKRVIHDKVIARVARLNDPNAMPTKPPAVVLDLDETVLDNRQFQTNQLRGGWAYNKEYWLEWEKSGANSVGVIPGAVEFIQHIQTLGIQPVYITNRNSQSQNETLAALDRFGISVPTELLLCADDITKSNKDSRREKIREEFDVLMYVGDNLRDFDNLFQDDDGLKDPAKRIDARKAKVDEHSSKFGEEWILLPNPAYGEWQRPLNKGLEDLKQLDPRLP